MSCVSSDVAPIKYATPLPLEKDISKSLILKLCKIHFCVENLDLFFFPKLYWHLHSFLNMIGMLELKPLLYFAFFFFLIIV